MYFMHLSIFSPNLPLICHFFFPLNLPVINSFAFSLSGFFCFVLVLFLFFWFSVRSCFIFSPQNYRIKFIGRQSTFYQNHFNTWKLILWQGLNYVFQGGSHLAGV